jgi:hypothetical protein
VETQFPIMLSTIKSYVAEMGITDNFYQQMVNTEPAEMVIYDSGNYRKLVPEYDPVYAEVRIAYQARRYGITTSEMRAREQDAKACDSGWGQRANANFMGLVALPTSFDPGIDCEEAAKWGLSKRVYLERLANLHDCALSDEEKSKFAATPNKSKRDSPILLHFETCVRNIMLSR